MRKFLAGGAALVALVGVCGVRARAQTAAVSGNADNGRGVFAAKGCSGCHGDLAQGTSTAPPIAKTQRTLAQVIGYVRQPAGQMIAYPPELITDSEITDIYAYLQSPPKAGDAAGTAASATAPPGNAQDGRKLFMSLTCYECHGREAQGTAAGPRLGPKPIPFVLLRNYVHHPAGSMPPFTDKVVSDQELANIYAFLQSLPQPPKVSSIPLLQ